MKLRYGWRTLALALVGAALAAIGTGSTASAGGGGCHVQQVTHGSGTNVEIDDSGCFSPAVLRTEPGATVVFTNAQAVPHNVSGLDWGTWKRTNGTLTEGNTLEQRFTKPGYYPYSCTLHVNMVGLVIVGDPEGAEPGIADVAPAPDGSGGMSATAWSLVAAGGMVALGIVGGGAFLRVRKR